MVHYRFFLYLCISLAFVLIEPNPTPPPALNIRSHVSNFLAVGIIFIVESIIQPHFGFLLSIRETKLARHEQDVAERKYTRR